MAKPGIDRERVATVLVEASLQGDKKTSERYDITTRTLQNWRNRLSQDVELSRLFAAKKKLATEEWASGLAPAIRGAIDFLHRATNDADVKDPAVIHAIAGALKILSGVAVTSRVLDARLARSAGGARPAGEAAREVLAGCPDAIPIH
ncbi:MAG: hypothetical protein IT374_26430 [Polyangiaceae bacterium]|nr:hypothetical protein [Polyangiaceae bacterium]